MTTYPECISTLNTIIQLMQTYLCLVVVVVFFFALKLVTQGPTAAINVTVHCKYTAY